MALQTKFLIVFLSFFSPVVLVKMERNEDTSILYHPIVHYNKNLCIFEFLKLVLPYIPYTVYNLGAFILLFEWSLPYSLHGMFVAVTT